MKRVMVVLELEGGEAVVVHSKELTKNAEEIQQALNLHDELDVIGKFSL